MFQDQSPVSTSSTRTSGCDIHPAADHPAADHPTADHPAADHPAADHLHRFLTVVVRAWISYFQWRFYDSEVMQEFSDLGICCTLLHRMLGGDIKWSSALCVPCAS